MNTETMAGLLNYLSFLWLAIPTGIVVTALLVGAAFVYNRKLKKNRR